VKGAKRKVKYTPSTFKVHLLEGGGLRDSAAAFKRNEQKREKLKNQGFRGLTPQTGGAGTTTIGRRVKGRVLFGDAARNHEKGAKTENRRPKRITTRFARLLQLTPVRGEKSRPKGKGPKEKKSSLNAA